MAGSIFTEINNAVLDLQASELQTYERPLKRLAQLLNHPDFQSHNLELTSGLDLDDFLERSRQTGGSMMGSAKLLWPDDFQQELGLKLLLIQKLGKDPQEAMYFGHHFFYTGSRKIISGIRSLTPQVIIPFARDYKSYIQSKVSQTALTAKASIEAQASPVANVIHVTGTFNQVLTQDSNNVAIAIDGSSSSIDA